MLAIFSEEVAQGRPEALASPGPNSSSNTRCSSGDLVARFCKAYASPVCISAPGGHTTLCYSHDHQALLSPRAFSATDDILCVFEGALQNLPALRQRYGLSKSVSDALLVIEAYRALRDRKPYPAHQVMRDLDGHFAFMLYDSHTQKIFVAADPSEKLSLFWGTTTDGAVAFSDNEQLIREACGRSFAAFPNGCYFSSDDGLRSFEHPLKEVMAVPRIDSQGEAYGSTFIVDMQRSLSRNSARATASASPLMV